MFLGPLVSVTRSPKAKRARTRVRVLKIRVWKTKRKQKRSKKVSWLEVPLAVGRGHGMILWLESF